MGKNPYTSEIQEIRTKKRLIAWFIGHDSHGIGYNGLCFLPEGDLPEGDVPYTHAYWLDEPDVDKRSVNA
jgi:hypothetical protein